MRFQRKVVLVTGASSGIGAAAVERFAQEGQVMSVDMPDSWANWKQAWQDFWPANTRYSTAIRI